MRAIKKKQILYISLLTFTLVILIEISANTIALRNLEGKYLSYLSNSLVNFGVFILVFYFISRYQMQHDSIKKKNEKPFKNKPKKNQKKYFIILIPVMVWIFVLALFQHPYGYWNAWETFFSGFMDFAPHSPRFGDGVNFFEIGAHNCVGEKTYQNCDFPYPVAGIYILDSINQLMPFSDLQIFPYFQILLFGLFLFHISQKIQSTAKVKFIIFLMVSPPILFIIERANADGIVFLMVYFSMNYLFQYEKNEIKAKNHKIKFVFSHILFGLSIAMKIYPIFLIPILLITLRKSRYILLFTTLFNVIIGFATNWIYLVNNAPQPTLQGIGFGNIFKFTSGAYDVFYLNQNIFLILQLMLFLLILRALIIHAKDVTSVFLPLISLYAFVWIAGINFNYKSIFLVGAFIDLIVRKNLDEILGYDSFLLSALIVNIFIPRGDVFINLLNLFVIFYISTQRKKDVRNN